VFYAWYNTFTVLPQTTVTHFLFVFLLVFWPVGSVAVLLELLISRNEKP
jgi:hypothetical protein